MSNHSKAAAAVLGLGVLLSGCTGGQIGVEPTTQVANLQKNVLQFAVGTANFGTGAIYLNTLVTYRQPNGLSATLLNTPVITGPPGFVNTGSTGIDAGTNTIAGTPPVQPGMLAVKTSFGTAGGAFAYGFAPANSNTSGTANYPGSPVGVPFGNALGAVNTSFTYTQPLFLPASSRLPFLIGPPAVPNFNDGTFPAGFLGYPVGFTSFAVTPVAGAYSLTATVPGNMPNSPPAAVQSASGTLTTTTGLPTETTPVITAGTGSVSVAVTAPPAGVTQQLLFFVHVDALGNASFSTFDATAGGTFSVPTTGFADQDEIAAYVVGADYNILALAPPTNLQQAPPLPAQADISVSPPDITVFVAAAPPGTVLAKKRIVR